VGKPVCYVSRMELDPGKSTIRCMYVYVCVCMYVPHKVWVGYRRVGNPMNIVIKTLVGGGFLEDNQELQGSECMCHIRFCLAIDG
jgi:hypothetical protein